MMDKKNKSVAKPKKGIARFSGFIKEFIDDIFADNVGVYAAQATFFIVLSAVPFIMLLVLCLKYFIDIDLQSVVTTLDKILPQQFSVFVADILSEVFERTQSTAVFSAAFITLLWSSSKGTTAIYCGLNCIYGTTKEQSWIRMRLLSFFYNILLVLIFAASITVLLFGDSIIRLISDEFVLAHYIFNILIEFRTVIFFVLFILAFAALFTFLPQKKNKYRGQLWGAAVTAIGWLLASYWISIYITYFPGVSYIYGSLTAVMLLMLWLFFCIYILLIGAEINKHIENGYFWRIGMRILRIRVKKRKKSKKNT
ncbi:MAG: YihY/virulence factor BrkB family protein [Clostridia bacterium]|nr:YihY/virulence factor BrkB family protein [Clostridia bacterium]